MRSVGELEAFVNEDLGLWQSFLLSLWVFALFLRKFANAAVELLGRWFLESLTEDEPLTSEGSSGRGDDSDAPVDAALVACSSSSSSGRDLSVRGALIPALPDSVVRDEVWPMLMSSPTVSLLLPLRQVNLSWNRFISSTIEWSALTFILLDAPGYLNYAMQNRLLLLSRDQRLRLESLNFRVLASEDMNEIESKVAFARRQIGSLPFYISASGCPPELDECPEYYGL